MRLRPLNDFKAVVKSIDDFGMEFRGVVVTGVEEDSEAHLVGIHAGDVISRCKGKRTNAHKFETKWNKYKPPFTITILRKQEWEPDDNIDETDSDVEEQMTMHRKLSDQFSNNEPSGWEETEDTSTVQGKWQASKGSATVEKNMKAMTQELDKRESQAIPGQRVMAKGADGVFHPAMVLEVEGKDGKPVYKCKWVDEDFSHTAHHPDIDTSTQCSSAKSTMISEHGEQKSREVTPSKQRGRFTSNAEDIIIEPRRMSVTLSEESDEQKSPGIHSPRHTGIAKKAPFEADHPPRPPLRIFSRNDVSYQPPERPDTDFVRHRKASEAIRKASQIVSRPSVLQKKGE